MPFLLYYKFCSVLDTGTILYYTILHGHTIPYYTIQTIVHYTKHYVQYTVFLYFILHYATYIVIKLVKYSALLLKLDQKQLVLQKNDSSVSTRQYIEFEILSR